MNLNIQLPAAVDGIFAPMRNKSLWGGRASTKSQTFGTVAIVKGYVQEKLIMCCREYQKSIDVSVKAVLENKIKEFGLHGFYKIRNTYIRGANGTEFIFMGLHGNTEGIKSTEGVDIAYVEEAESTSQGSWNTLDPTIRKPGSEIWAAWNARFASDPTYKRYIVNPIPDLFIRRLSYRDNPWFYDTALPGLMEHMKKTDFDLYMHIWEGELYKRSASQIMGGKWRTDIFNITRDQKGTWRVNGGEEASAPRYGLDFGFSQDPTFGVRVFITGTPGKKGSRLWIDHEFRQIGLETVDMPARVKSIQEAERHTIRADNARPETISHLNNNGLRVEGAEKWKGSVEDGIAFLRSFDEIIIHERCRFMIEEAKLYSYKTDKLTGEVLPDIVDANNHGWDAVRYALAKDIKPGGEGGVVFI